MTIDLKYIDQAKNKTKKHIDRVGNLLNQFGYILSEKGAFHDETKFTDEELLPLANMEQILEEEGEVEYGSEKYKERLEILKPMLEHHYKHNSHHPEHYENGVDGMNLYDIVEMFCDWKAASERSGFDTINISALVKRFNINPQLESIFINTAKVNGWKVK